MLVARKGSQSWKCYGAVPAATYSDGPRSRIYCAPSGRGGGTGRRAGFKIRFWRQSASSILAPGTIDFKDLRRFLIFLSLPDRGDFPSAHRTRIERAAISHEKSLCMNTQVPIPECPLFSKADAFTPAKLQFSGSAFGQKQTFSCDQGIRYRRS